MTKQPQPSIGDLLERDHRRVDDLFGRFLAAIAAADLAAAVRAIDDFDEALRRHTALEEEHLFPAEPAGKLAPVPGETAQERLFRELRVEHVQVRELSGILRQLLGEGRGAAAAQGLAGSLARRWDEHTSREESDAYPGAVDALDELRASKIRRALEADRAR